MDENAGCSQKILDEAKGGIHRLLLTSRPYGVTCESEAADLEVFHRGVSE